jgi:hypothetical protein
MTRILLALALLMPAAAAKADQPALAHTTAGFPVVVHGAYPGYTDHEVAQLVRSCVSAPVETSGTSLSDWQLTLTLSRDYMPRPMTRVTASLAYDGRTIAVRSARVEPASVVPAQDLCQIATNLTQQIWPRFGDSQAG